MKVVVKIVVAEGYDKFISLDEDEMWIEEANNKVLINCDYKDRFNSLISLFMLKNEWNLEEVIGPLYEVVFENNGVVEHYNFKEAPDNFGMFMGYLVRLAGDSL